ncbi:putative RNA-directed DNA polymerase [Helianthus annuus]|nr:putative RNA-directed DNA polymerase [Helianthus annuus]
MSTSEQTSIPFHSLCHLINIKLTSSNYLTWRSQVLPVLSYIGLEGHLDGTSIAPSETVTNDDKTEPNPKYLAWKEADQKVVLFLHSSLTEEAMAETIGHTSAHHVWKALETAYSNHSIERMHTLRGSLRQLQKGTSTVSEFGRKFKAMCDQLAAIGHPVTEDDKRHWFLCGLGSSFETFSTAQRTIQPAPAFRDLLAHAENHEIFLQNLHGNQTPQAAFSANSSRFQPTNKASRGRFRGSSSNRGRTTSNRRPPHCQLCRKEGHYASACPDLVGYAQKVSLTPLDAHLAQAFQAQCNINSAIPDWTADTGATTHMLRSNNGLDESYADTGPKNSEGHC